MTDRDGVDWSKGCYRDMLVHRRKMMRLEDVLERIAAWMELRQGMSASVRSIAGSAGS